MNWHLHATIKPHWSWTLSDVASALQRDVERHGIKPLVITNLFDDGKKNYRELIPTKHHEGTEADATRELFRMGVLLNNAGWRVRRLKVEGDPRHRLEDDSGGALVRQRALYFECHVKLTAIDVDGGVTAMVARQCGAALSTTSDNTFGTFRHAAMGHVYERSLWLWEKLGSVPEDFPHVEAAVLDTRPELDEEWLAAARAPL